MSASYYFIVGDVVIVSGDFSDYTTTLSSGTPTPSAVPGREFYTDFVIASRATLECLVSHSHERQHHLDMQTTSFGLLTWRVQRCIADDVLAVLREAQRAGTPLHREGSDGRTGIRIVGLDGRPFLDWFSEVAPALKSRRSQIDLDSVENGLRSLLRFRDLLLEAPDVTIGEAIEVANTALRYLRRRCDLDSKWTFTTALPENSKCSPMAHLPDKGIERVVDGREVLELSAFLAECPDVRLASQDPRLVNYWRTSLGGVSRGWLIPFENDGLPSQRVVNMFRLLADYCLSGPGDPALLGDGTVNIECLLPQWRLVDALEWLHSDPESQPQTLLLDDPIWDGPASYHNIYANLADADLNGPRGWGADALVRGGPLGYLRAVDPALSFVPYRLGEYLRGFAQKASAPIGVALPTTGHEALFHQPLLEFFDDHVQTNRPVGVDESWTGYLYDSALIEYIATETALSLCDRGSGSQHARSLLLRYEERLATDFAQDDGEPPDIRAALRAAGLPDWTVEL